MNSKVEKILEEYCISRGWKRWTDDDDLFELLINIDMIQEDKIGSHRHWDIYRRVIKVGDTYIGFITAKTTGDMSAKETGWEFDPDTICEMREVTKTIITYEPI